MDVRSIRSRLSLPAVFLIALTLVLAPVAPALAGAGMLDTGSLIDQADSGDTRAHLLEQLHDAEVRAQLIEMGVDPKQAEDRVARLTDAELARLEAHLQTDPAGASGALGVVAIVFLVFVVLDAMGITDIFSFVQPSR